MTATEFVKAYYPMAKAQSLKFGLDPAIQLAQAAWECGWATSYSARNDKNFFGVSASSFYNKEFWNGTSKRATKDSAGYYRVYSSVQNSFYDHAWLLSNSTRYAKVKANFKNANGYIDTLIVSGYFTGNKEQYKAGFLSNYAKIKALIPATTTDTFTASATPLLIFGGLFLAHKIIND
jgi:flagellum-specific peptidoglycan hydrolase FlgJ